MSKEPDVQTRQLFVRECVLFGLVAARPCEPPLTQSARGKPDTDVAVNQYFYPVGTAINEQVRVARTRYVEQLDYVDQRGFETGAHVP